jgi:hypothetical protein
VPNKVPADIKAMVLAALDKAGGVDYLRDRAFDQPVAFLGLVGKVLPLQVTGKDGVPLQVDFRWADAPAGAVSSATNMVASVTIEADAEPDLIEWATPDTTLAND